jgi:hypothetical protein
MILTAFFIRIFSLLYGMAANRLEFHRYPERFLTGIAELFFLLFSLFLDLLEFLQLIYHIVIRDIQPVNTGFG